MFWYDFLIFSTDIPFQKISAPYYVFIIQFWVRCPERSQTWFSSIFKLRVSVPLLLHSQRSRLVLTLIALLWERIRKCLFSSSLHIPLQLYLSIDCSLPDNCCWHPHTLLAPHHGRQAGLLLRPGLWPLRLRGADHDRVQSQGEAGTSWQRRDNGGIPGKFKEWDDSRIQVLTIKDIYSGLHCIETLQLAHCYITRYVLSGVTRGQGDSPQQGPEDSLRQVAGLRPGHLLQAVGEPQGDSPD